MNIARFLGVVICGASTLSCSEEFPARVLEDFLEPIFIAGDSLDVRIFGSFTTGEMIIAGESFAVGLRNLTDEILEAPSRVRGNIELWSVEDSTFRRTISFEETFFDTITILPESLFTVSVVWDLRDDSCRFAYRSLKDFDRFMEGQAVWYRGRKVFRFRARGSIQVFPNVETKLLPEVEFKRSYAFNFLPSKEFLDQVKCEGF